MAIKKARGIGALGAVFAAIALPLLIAAPAQAISKDSCVVTPVRPYYAGQNTAGGKKIVNYDIKVDCNSDRDVQIQHRILERDNSSPPTYSTIKSKHTHFVNEGFFGGIHTVLNDKLPLAYQDSDGDDEVLHEVRIRIWTDEAAHNWSGWEKSNVRSIKF